MFTFKEGQEGEEGENDSSPHFRIIEKEFDKLTFVLNNVDLSIANAFRRVMIAEVPTMAIDLVMFDNNTVRIRDCLYFCTSIVINGMYCSLCFLTNS